MSNVIDFLERMGQDADLRHATGDQIAQTLSNANVSAELRAAIVDGDRAKIEMLLGAKANVCAIVFPVEEDNRVVGKQAAAAAVG